MLKRRLIRRYLMAMLCSEEIPQTADCEAGPLWENCSGDLCIFDSWTHQMFRDADAGYAIGPDCVGINFLIENERYTATATCIQSADIEFSIEIVAHARNGEKRQDILDQVEERIWRRFFANVKIQDAQTGEILKPVFCMADENTINIRSSDESDFQGNYTIRTMSFSMTVKECIRQEPCDIVPLCFDFSALTILDKPDQTTQL